MILYVFKPQGHVALTFCVVVNSSEEAFTIVNDYINLNFIIGSETVGWGTDYYKMIVVEPGKVFEHEND